MAVKIGIQLSKEQQKMAAAGCLVVGALGFVYCRYFWFPTAKRIAAAKTQMEEVRGKITKAKGQAARLDKIKEEIARLNQQAAEAEKRLPKTRDLPAVIDTLSRLARQYRVGLTSFAPAGTAAKQYFMELPYTVGITGAYHDVGRFLAAIAMEERIFNVRNVNFAGGAAAKGELTVTFTLVSYQYKG